MINNKTSKSRPKDIKYMYLQDDEIVRFGNEGPVFEVSCVGKGGPSLVQEVQASNTININGHKVYVKNIPAIGDIQTAIIKYHINKWGNDVFDRSPNLKIIFYCDGSAGTNTITHRASVTHKDYDTVEVVKQKLTIHNIPIVKSPYSYSPLYDAFKKMNKKKYLNTKGITANKEGCCGKCGEKLKETPILTSTVWDCPRGCIND